MLLCTIFEELSTRAWRELEQDFSLCEIEYQYLSYTGATHSSRLDRFYPMWQEAFSEVYMPRAFPRHVKLARQQCQNGHVPIMSVWELAPPPCVQGPSNGRRPSVEHYSKHPEFAQRVRHVWAGIARDHGHSLWDLTPEQEAELQGLLNHHQELCREHHRWVNITTLLNAADQPAGLASRAMRIGISTPMAGAPCGRLWMRPSAPPLWLTWPAASARPAS